MQPKKEIIPDAIPGGPKIAQFFVCLNFIKPINRFSKLFHCQNQEKTCNNTITKDPTTKLSVSLHCLVKFQVS